MLTHKRLRELLDYNSETGIIRWRVNRPGRGAPKAGDEAGDLASTGYRRLSVDGLRYFAHRLAWFHAHGEWPPGPLDHRNGVRADNRLSNLRLATPSQNMWNMGVSKRSTSGLKGAYWHKRERRWQAVIGAGRKSISLGYFATKEEAHAAYARAAAIHHGEFARLS